MTEIMLRDAGAAHGLDYVILRYFNVAGADPKLRTGQSTKGATHLIKVAVETALGKRAKIDVFGTDYPTAGRHLHPRLHPCHRPGPGPCDALAYLRAGGRSVTLNCGYSHGFSVVEVIDAVKRVSGVDFRVDCAAGGRAIPRRSWRSPTASGKRSAGARNSTISPPSSPMRWRGNASSSRFEIRA